MKTKQSVGDGQGRVGSGKGQKKRNSKQGGQQGSVNKCKQINTARPGKEAARCRGGAGGAGRQQQGWALYTGL